MTRAKRRTARALIVAALLSAGVSAHAQSADALGTTQALARAGAPQLVLDRVTRYQPTDPTHAPEWEALRCNALAALGRNDELIERIAALPRDAHAPPLAACFAAGARAAYALGRHGEARRYAARLLWQFAPPAAEVQSVRRLIIADYLAERRGDEAFRAMLRFEQDYHPVKRTVLAQFVMGLLALDRDKEALNWFAQLDDSQPAKLALRFRAHMVTRDAALKRARAALAKGGDPGYWRVLLELAREPRDAALRIDALEHLLNGEDSAMGQAATGTAPELWQEYLTAATHAANQQGLLVGEDASWVKAAAGRSQSEPQIARALYARLARQAHTSAARGGAQLQLILSLQSAGMDRAALRLFGEAFPDVKAVDAQARYRLGAIAQVQRQAKAAARYWQDLPAPAGTDRDEWLLRVARERWRAGIKPDGIEDLARELRSRKALAPAALSAAVNFAAELNEAGEPALSVPLLEAALPFAGVSQSRAILFALGRAHELGGEPALAAEAYLRSALLAKGATPDAAALRARFRAAMSLARSRYRQDARAQLEWFIANGQDAAEIEAARNALKRL